MDILAKWGSLESQCIKLSVDDRSPPGELTLYCHAAGTGVYLFVSADDIRQIAELLLAECKEPRL